MTGALSRRKGASFERDFCRWVREEFGIAEFGRNLKQYACAQEGDTDPIAGFLPECKHHKKLNLRAFWKQAVEQAKKKELKPLLVYKAHGAREFRALIPSPTAWVTGATWRYDFEYTHDIGPAELALILRENL